MSATHAHDAALALSGDPTNTRRIREDFRRDVRGRFRRLRGDIRRLAGYDRDVFGLRTRLASPDDIDEAPTRSGKTRAFLEWLQQRLREGVLEAVPVREVRDGQHWTATYIRAAYRRGWENATGRLQQAGASVDSRDLGAALDLPVPQRQLARLYTRAFENLEGITTEMAQPIRETLTEGLAQGWNPKKMARELTDEVETIERTRAEVLARTETINSYTTATIDRYERAGVEEVVGDAEWASADDDRVCPICEHLDGDVFSLDEVKTGTFRFDPSESEPDHLAGTYPLRPPTHPNCRCTLYPLIG